MQFNYQRHIPNEKSWHVDLISVPLELPRHSVDVFMLDDILPENIIWKDQVIREPQHAFIKKYHAQREKDGAIGFVYVVRKCTLTVKLLPPPS